MVFFLDNEANNSNETQQSKEAQLIGGKLISWLFYEYCQGSSLSHSYQEQIQGAVGMRIELCMGLPITRPKRIVNCNLLAHGALRSS